MLLDDVFAKARVKNLAPYFTDREIAGRLQLSVSDIVAIRTQLGIGNGTEPRVTMTKPQARTEPVGMSRTQQAIKLVVGGEMTAAEAARKVGIKAVSIYQAMSTLRAKGKLPPVGTKPTKGFSFFLDGKAEPYTTTPTAARVAAWEAGAKKPAQIIGTVADAIALMAKEGLSVAVAAKRVGVSNPGVYAAIHRLHEAGTLDKRIKVTFKPKSKAKPKKAKAASKAKTKVARVPARKPKKKAAKTVAQALTAKASAS